DAGPVGGREAGPALGEAVGGGEGVGGVGGGEMVVVVVVVAGLSEEVVGEGGGVEVGGDGVEEGLEGVHDVVEGVGEALFGLEHVELAEVAWGVALLGAEGGGEGPDLVEGLGEGFEVELGGDGEVFGGAEEVVFMMGGGGVGGGDGEDLAGALAVGGGDDGGVALDEPWRWKKDVVLAMTSERSRRRRVLVGTRGRRWGTERRYSGEWYLDWMGLCWGSLSPSTWTSRACSS
ncbi:Uncharacterized protein Tdes44962_MAKER08405, partial [Teratosphaeria destructans]